MNIILVGFMGCGKSSTARFLSKQYGFRILDTDRIIEKKLKLTIKEIFKQKGESFFRKTESEIIRTNLSFCGNCVISTGGGLPCYLDNMEILKNIGWVFHLDMEFNDIISRVKNKTNRPLLENIESARELFEQRKSCYDKAHFRIDANQSTQRIAEDIMSKINS